jgi:hypothetical protein
MLYFSLNLKIYGKNKYSKGRDTPSFPNDMPNVTPCYGLEMSTPPPHQESCIEGLIPS